MVAVTVKAGDIVATPSSGGAGLGLQTQVSGGPDYTITGGTVAGEKLLHSFDVFNLPEGTTATFDGAQIPGRITDIYGRILTESTRLDGSLNLVNFNGGAFTPSINLFNPNGFILGTGFSTNASSLGLFAVDGLLFGCGGASGGVGSCAISVTQPTQLQAFNASTRYGDLLNGQSLWGDASGEIKGNKMLGFYNEEQGLAAKSILVESDSLAVSRLNLAATTIDFGTFSEVSVKQLSVTAPWFAGAVLGISSTDLSGVALPEGFSSGDLRLAFGEITQVGAAAVAFTPNTLLAASGAESPVETMLVDRKSLYVGPYYDQKLLPGYVRFSGQINAIAESAKVLDGSRILREDQALINVAAKSAYVGKYLKNLGDDKYLLTSSFGPYADVESSVVPDYKNLYHGFGATIVIDPQVNPYSYSGIVDASKGTLSFVIATKEGRVETLNFDQNKKNFSVIIDTEDGKMGMFSLVYEQNAEDALVFTDVEVTDPDGVLGLRDGFDASDLLRLLNAGDAGLAAGSGDAGSTAVQSSVLAIAPNEVASGFASGEQLKVRDVAAFLGLESANAVPLTTDAARQVLKANQEAIRRAVEATTAVPERTGALLAAAPASQGRQRGLLTPQFNRAAYTPAILQVRFTEAKGRTTTAGTDVFLDLTLIPAEAAVVGKRVELSSTQFKALLKQFYGQLSRQEDLRLNNPAAPARQLYDLLIRPLAAELDALRVTTLLIGADRGLQALPFAALHSGEGFFGDRYAFALTPSLSLTNLSQAGSGEQRLLLAGASQFEGLAPLPLVPQELREIASIQASDLVLNNRFTPATVEQTAAEARYNRVHLATHAEFLPGGPARSKLYTGTATLPLNTLATLRQRRQGAPLDLITLSACRTALGDADSELGFAGLALQAGARSAIGTLWYVDDVATSAYFIQMYRYLKQGLPKAEALQFTRRDFASGRVQRVDDKILAVDGQVLMSGLSTAQQRRVSAGMGNPYFWAGIELLGSPW